MQNKIIYGTGLHEYGASLQKVFVDQEALMLYCRDTERPLFHAWRHTQGFLAGSRDASLPFWENSVLWLRGQGNYVFVRPFGGLAIPVDRGVLNITLMLPGDPSIDDCFDLLSDWIKKALLPMASVTVGEIEGSYCPGRYDLAINRIKFAGLAQRRIKGVVAVSAFINLFSLQSERAGLVSDFYTMASDSIKPTWVPQIHAHTIASLDSLLSEYRFNDPWYFLSLLSSVYPFTQKLPLDELTYPYYNEAVQRISFQRNTQEWIPIK